MFIPIDIGYPMLPNNQKMEVFQGIMRLLLSVNPEAYKRLCYGKFYDMQYAKDVNMRPYG